jgi:outer membrane protein insertion porin family
MVPATHPSIGNHTRFSYRPTAFCLACLHVILALAMFCHPKVSIAQVNERGRAAVLPFRVFAPKPLEFPAKGLQEMLTLCMEKRGYHMISPEVIAQNSQARSASFDLKDILTMGRELNVDWIVRGSITQIGKEISLDFKIVDIANKRELISVSTVAESLETLGEAVDRVVAAIDSQILGVAQIVSVRVTGNHRIEKEAILAVVGAKEGNKIDNEELDNDLRNIYKMGFFTDVKIHIQIVPMGSVVVFEVTEKPSLAKIVFEGNKKVHEEDLKKDIGIEPYAVLDQNEISQSVNRLKGYYRRKGYYHAEVNARIHELPGNLILLTYEITEGEKAPIFAIQFAGNEVFDDDKLRGVMKTSKRGFFSWITNSGYLDDEVLEFDVQKIAAFYQNHGFIRIEIGEPQITYEEGKGLGITIEINEGKRYSFGTVSAEGDLIRPADEVLAKLGAPQKKIFNREIVLTDLQTLKDIYADEGYAYAEVVPITKEDDENLLVDLSYQITRGPRVRIERIDITGNTATRDKVIRRALEVSEGEYFSASALRRSLENLRRLGFFEDVEIHTYRKEPRDSEPCQDISERTKGRTKDRTSPEYKASRKNRTSKDSSDNKARGTVSASSTHEPA